MTRLDDAQWAEVRRLYESGEGTVVGIAGAFGIDARAIHGMARRHGWPRRSEMKGRRVGRRGPAAAVPPGHPTRSVRQALIRRLYLAINLKLQHWENRMAGGEELSSADSERMAKEITTMIRGFEAVAEAEGAIEKRDAGDDGQGRRGKRRSADDTTVADDAERMRREIAERLERLRAAGPADCGAV